MEPYIVQRRVEYLPWSADAYARNGWEFCVGSAQSCTAFAEGGAIRVPWGERPEPARQRDARSLILKPSAKALRDTAPPAWLRELTALEHLFMPSTMVRGLQPDALPASLVGLTLQNVAGARAALGKDDPRWPAAVSLPNVKALRLLDEPGAEQSKTLLGLSATNLPALEYVECLVHRSVGRLDAIRTFPRLQFAWLEFVRSYDIVEYIGGPVRALSLVSADAKFPFEHLSRLDTTELLRLNGMACVVDCAVLTALPRLRELTVYNSKKFANLEALLACERLESIEFVNCGRPFGRALREQLESRTYERLEIAFA